MKHKTTAELRIIFDLYASNTNDGPQLDFNGFSNCFAKLQLQYNEKELKDLLLTADDDNSGFISFEEFRKLFDQANTTHYQSKSVFIGKPQGGSRPPGVYRRSNKNTKLIPLFYAVPSVRYKARFPVEPIVERSIQRDFGLYLRQELAKNVAKNVKAGKADTRTGIF